MITAGTACGTEAPGALLNTVYWYDKAGNVTTVRDNILNSKVDARYDALNRLVVVSSTNYITGVAQMAPMSETYTYNAIGNLTGRFGVGGTGAITYPAAGSARPHAAIAAANGNSYTYDANGNMTVRQEKSNDQLFVYAQTWTVDNRLASVTKRDLTGTVFAETTFFYDGDGARVRKDDPDGTTLYAGPVEQTIGPGGTATAEYFDDISGTSTLTAFVATRNETVTAGFQQTFTVPPTGLGSEPWGVRYQIWLTVPTTDTYRLAVYADDGFLLSGQGLSLSNATTRDVTTTEASTVLTLTPGAIYNFALTYLNYTSATTSALQILWRRGGGALEVVPREAIRARGRRDYYSFGGAVVAMKDGVMNAAPRTLSYLHGDHLGSASLTTNISGTVVSQQRYKPYGEVRWSSGAGMPTDRQFTSQTRLTEGYVGTLYDYVARAYDPVLGRFISPDTIVPGAGNGQTLNRYAYVLNSPLRYADPSGHRACNDDGDCEPASSRSDWSNPPFIFIGSPVQGDSSQGFGATNFANKNWQAYYKSFGGLHSGLDFDAKEGDPVYARVEGTVYGIDQFADETPNVVIIPSIYGTGDAARRAFDEGKALGIGYSNTEAESLIIEGTMVKPETIIGKIHNKENNPHFHMSIYRRDPKGGFTLYNPVHFIPFMREQIVARAEAEGYAKGESATSIWSFHSTWGGDSPNYWLEGREEVADSLRVNRFWPR